MVGSYKEYLISWGCVISVYGILTFTVRVWFITGALCRNKTVSYLGLQKFRNAEALNHFFSSVQLLQILKDIDSLLELRWGEVFCLTKCSEISKSHFVRESWDLSKCCGILSPKEALKLWNWIKENYFLLMCFTLCCKIPGQLKFPICFFFKLRFSLYPTKNHN